VLGAAQGVAAARPRSDGSAGVVSGGYGRRVWDRDGQPHLEIGLGFFLRVYCFSVRVYSFSVSFEKTDTIMSIFLCVLTRTEKSRNFFVGFRIFLSGFLKRTEKL